MSNYVGWWNFGDAGRAAGITDQIESALSPFAVDGLATRELGAVTFAHARFDTVPEAEHEHQPILSGDGSAMVVATARVDNLDEVRLALPKDLPVHTDAHVVLAAYLAWGRDMVYRLQGDYSFLIWDSTRRRLFGARDRLGVRPLYLACTPASIVAGTSLAPMIAHPDVPRDPDRGYLAQRLVNDIWDTERSPFRSIRRIDAGQCFTVDPADHRASVRTYWAPRLASSLRVATPDDEAETRRLVDEAVRTRMRATGPVVCQLSGGLDSSMVTGIASQLAPAEERPLTLTISMPGSAIDETGYARTVARRHFLHLEEVPLRASGDAGERLRLTRLCGAPLRLARCQTEVDIAGWTQSIGSRVVLTGDGGDAAFEEWFCHILRAARHPHHDHLGELARRYYRTTAWRRRLFIELVRPALPKPIEATVRRARRVRRAHVDPYAHLLTSVPRPPRVGLRAAADESWRFAWLSGWWQSSLDQGHEVGALDQIEERYPLNDARLVDHVSDLWFPQSGADVPYREAQRRISADLLPDEVATRREKADHYEALVLRSKGWDPSLCSVEGLDALGLVRAPAMAALTSEVYGALSSPSSTPLAESWQIRTAVGAWAIELWLREVVGQKSRHR